MFKNYQNLLNINMNVIFFTIIAVIAFLIALGAVVTTLIFAIQKNNYWWIPFTVFAVSFAIFSISNEIRRIKNPNLPDKKSLL
jgi:hypothetical protein